MNIDISADIRFLLYVCACAIIVILSMEANLRFWVVTPPWEATHLSARREPLYDNELAKVQSAYPQISHGRDEWEATWHIE
jgi:hypothetical protein